MPLLVGETLEGFCGGYFGRDSYGTKRVEAVGADWVVARDIATGWPEFAAGPDIHQNLAEFRGPIRLDHPDDR